MVHSTSCSASKSGTERGEPGGGRGCGGATSGSSSLQWRKSSWRSEKDAASPSLDCAPRAEVSLPSLVQTDNKLLNKVLLVCAYLCEEVTALSAHAREKLLPSLLLLAEPRAGVQTPC